MTSNTLKDQSNRIERSKANEDVRHNKAREGAQNFKDYASGGAAIGQAAGNVAKLFVANDPSWYTQDKQLTKDVGSLSFARPAGTAVYFHSQRLTIGSVAQYKFVPTIGTANIADIAAKNVYAYVRYKNSGHSNYDSPDLMMYLLAMDSVYTAWALGMRAYNAVKYVNTMNRSSQSLLTEACGFDFSDLSTHLSDLRTFLNQLRLRLTPFYLPKDLTYYQRHMWLAANVFADDNLQKSQYHVFYPAVYFRYSELLTELTPTSYVTGGMTFDEYVASVNDMLNPLVQSESIGIMAGDILKAYGSGNTVQLAQVGEESTLQVIYSEEVLEQIQNATSCAEDKAIASLKGFTIGQSTDENEDISIVQGYRVGSTWLTTSPAIFGTYQADTKPVLDRLSLSDEAVIVAKTDQPSPDRVFTATRLVYTAEKYDVQSTDAGHTLYYVGWKITTCGSEIVTGIKVWANNPVGPGMTSIDVADGVGAATASAVGTNCTAISSFNSFPPVRFAASAFTTTGSAPAVYYTRINGENIISVSTNELTKLHDVALMSMFGLPYTASADKPAFR